MKHHHNQQTKQLHHSLQLLAIALESDISPTPNSARIRGNRRSALCHCSFVFLRTSHEGNHTKHGFETFFSTQHNAFEIHSNCCMYQQFLCFYREVVFYCMDMPQLTYSFAPSFGLFLVFW